MLYRRIVIGVDFSTASLNAVRWVATRFAPRAELFLAHVIARPHTPSFLRTHLQVAVGAENEEPTLFPGLSGFADLAGASRAEVVVRHGQPATELAALAHEVGADLVCVGRSSRRRGGARFGATTPQRLLERTSLPVLLVPSASRGHPGTLLAAVSDGVEALEVLRSTATLADFLDARVDLLHALNAGILALRAEGCARTAEGRDPVEPGAQPNDERIRQLTEQWLTRHAADMRMAEGRVRSIVHIGDAADAIVASATRAPCDLIVIGRRIESPATAGDQGRVGSTTRLITWATPCPVLVLGAQRIVPEHRKLTASRQARRWDEPRATTPRLVGKGRERGPAASPDGDDAA